MEKMSQGFRNTCINKIGADPERVEGIRNGQFIEDDPKLKCYAKCIMSLMKTLKDGKLDIDAAMKQVKIMAADDIAPRLVAAGTSCYDEVQNDDACEYAWSYVKCLHSKDAEVFFFP
ncbi:hypothetical protein QAD02_020231 [Eretmocerus hayati]|uniref:Uncharacterized protein n=1 Tax=Eretmocerus hayati TaxID=131215 RepID=A0ACC2PPB4_9HYME|nr:hypothetical protein QAD02_020231 [Eretmocerus hayati]